MRKLVLSLFFVMALMGIQAQESTAEMVQVGDVLEIGRPDGRLYKHINFPRANFIIKKGGIANYKSVAGNKVVVTAISEKKDGTLKIKIKRMDGRKFFNSHRVVSADLQNAIKAQELSML